MKHPSLLALCLCWAHLLLSQSAIRIDTLGDSGPDVLVLPGFATPGEAYRDMGAAVAKTHRVHLVTYPGVDGVPALDSHRYAGTLAAVADYLNALPDGRVHVIGHSMGGNLATELAADHPERIGHVVVVDALPCMRCVMMPGVPAEAIRDDAPQTRAQLQMTPAQRRGMLTQMSAGMTEDTARAARLATWMSTVAAEDFIYGYTDLLRLDLRPRLAEVQAPVTVLASPSYGADVVRDNMNGQYAGLPDYTLQVAPGGRHYLHWDQPAWTVARIREALDGGDDF